MCLLEEVFNTQVSSRSVAKSVPSQMALYNHRNDCYDDRYYNKKLGYRKETVRLLHKIEIRVLH